MSDGLCLAGSSTGCVCEKTIGHADGKDIGDPWHFCSGTASHRAHGWADSVVSQNAIIVGDRMRFSTELLGIIHAGPKHQSQIGVVKRIERNDDGTVMLYVGRDEGERT